MLSKALREEIPCGTGSPRMILELHALQEEQKKLREGLQELQEELQKLQ